MQAGEVMSPALHLPDWVGSMLAFFLILGFPLAMVLAWAFDMTPDGLKKEEDIDRSQSIASTSGWKLNYTIIALLAVVLVYFVWESRFQMGSESDSQEPAAQTVNPGIGQKPEIPSTEDDGPDSNTIAMTYAWHEHLLMTQSSLSSAAEKNKDVDLTATSSGQTLPVDCPDTNSRERKVPSRPMNKRTNIRVECAHAIVRDHRLPA